MNIDKLEVCYTAPRSLAESLKETSYMEYPEFRLVAEESNGVECFIQIEVLYSEGTEPLEWMHYGKIKIGSTFEKEEDELRYVWIRVDNRALYTRFPCGNIVPFLYFIADTIGLTFNNITKLDIAFDSNVNYFKRIKSAIKDKSLVPVVLGKAYPEAKEIIPAIGYYHTADRERYRTSTIILSSKDKEMSLCGYNKSHEVMESEKDYILEGMAGTVYRLEVRLRKKSLRDFLDSERLDFEKLYLSLTDTSLLFQIYLHFANRLIRFRKGRDTVSILEL